MAIKFENKTAEDNPRPGTRKPEVKAAAEARFATPIEAVEPVNPDAAAPKAFASLPAAEKSARRKKTR